MRLYTKQKRLRWLVAPCLAINQAENPIHGVEDEVVLDGVADVLGLCNNHQDKANMEEQNLISLQLHSSKANKVKDNVHQWDGINAVDAKAWDIGPMIVPRLNNKAIIVVVVVVAEW